MGRPIRGCIGVWAFLMNFIKNGLRRASIGRKLVYLRGEKLALR